MIRKWIDDDLTPVMDIWLVSNIKSHYFIAKEYWMNNYSMVKELLPQAEVYVYEDDKTHQIFGFVGLTDNYIEGIFVKEGYQSKGIGKQLLNYIKEIKSEISLSVYQKNIRAIAFYQREKFMIKSENINAMTNEKELIMTWNRRITHRDLARIVYGIYISDG